MRSIRLLLTFIFATIVVASITSLVDGGSYHIVPGTGFFVDELSSHGDTYLFHGINNVHKGPGLRTLTANDISFIKSMGFNVVRFGILWTNIQPYGNSVEFNHSYLLNVKSQVDTLWQNGIRVFLDMHQDCFSSRFECGPDYDTVPMWAASPPFEEQYYPGGNKSFPLPMQKPNFVQPDEPNFDPQYLPWGQPSDSVSGQGCSFAAWAMCYTTFALGAAAQRFYDNVNSSADLFANAWAQVARVFEGHPAVIGYEIINEPWLGQVPLSLDELDPLTNPNYWDLWFAGVADSKNLAPFYDRVAAKIRSVDVDTPIFFEPASGGAFFEGQIAFEHGPGGQSFNARGKNVFSWHAYCPIIQADGIHFNISNAILNFVRKEVCEIFQHMDMQNRAAEVAKRGFGGFLSEFGSIPSTKIAAEYMDSMMQELDKIQHSFTFWELYSLKNAPQFIRDSLRRSYPMKVPGTVVQYSTHNETTINASSGNQQQTVLFQVEYTLSHLVTSSSQGVEAAIFLAPQAFPPGSNFQIEAFPPSCVFVSQPNTMNVVTVTHDMSKLPSQSAIALKFVRNYSI